VLISAESILSTGSLAVAHWAGRWRGQIQRWFLLDRCGSHGTFALLPRQADRIPLSAVQFSAAAVASDLVCQYSAFFVCLLCICIYFL